MSITINKNYHPRLVDRLQAGESMGTKVAWEDLSLKDLDMHYEICLKYGFDRLAKSIELEYEVRQCSDHIVPRELFKQLSPSMFSLPFAKSIWDLKPLNYSQFIQDSYKRYFPPSFAWYIGYIMALSFGKIKIADQIKHTIKSFSPVAACTPAFLELTANIPGVAERLSELEKILRGARPVKSIQEDQAVQEDIEKHDELNPILFEDNKLKPEIRDKALEVAEELLKNIEECGVTFKLKDIVITGSNASYNYTKDSDLDLHLIADLSDVKDPEGLYPILFDAFKSAFNKKFDIDFYGVPVEVYIENADTPVVSNGIYSVQNDAWVKEPENKSIPEVDLEAIEKALEPWVNRYKELIDSLDEETETDESSIDEYVNDLYATRAKGLQGDGEYSTENLIFKEIRNLGYLENLKDLRNKIIQNRLSLSEDLI